MAIKRILVIAIILFSLTACNEGPTITKEEIKSYHSVVESYGDNSNDLIKALKSARAKKGVTGNKDAFHQMNDDELRNYANMARVYKISHEQGFSHDEILQYLSEEFNAGPEFVEEYLFENLESFESGFDGYIKENQALIQSLEDKNNKKGK